MGEMIVKSDADQIMEQVISKGDLSKLTVDERNKYYLETCRSVGLNPLTRPFEYLVLNGRTVMYARKDAADQLRQLHKIDIQVIDKVMQGDLFCVTVRATDRDGRADEDMGVVVMPKTGANEVRANMILKAITKAKRRVTLSICGLGFLDETEIEDLKAEPKRKGAVRTVTSADMPSLTQESNPPQSANSVAPAVTAAPSPPLTQDGAAELSDANRLADDTLAIAATNGKAALQTAWRNLEAHEQKALKNRLDTHHKKVAELADAHEGVE